MDLGLTLFVELERLRDAADFYRAAFGAEQVATHNEDGRLSAVEMRLGGSTFNVCGANPKREQEPQRGGPFFPKAAGAVNAIVNLTVPDLDAAVRSAIAAGATVRNGIETDTAGRRVAALFDPDGHIWGLVERQTVTTAIAA
ncbi:putative glyoxalase superfamily protein PhnB [Nitrobacter vulgaris]|uniref:VOC domain-containing protein n=1 Tax=Nitrobacter vulgaris TaxID=29421 RepID=A0A1V4I1U7_NITVU|nr:VOC family protein [Nitrobacter vulgaris]MDR6303763.1 putative glyoxalase superfamily protein PhnB [Nitrobacter vulgaris]OPH84197.1 hypothetical protein B2M20_02630 [Nitrobacter vulgaris]